MRTADFHAEKSSGNDPPREDLPAQSTGDDQHRSLPSTDIKLQFVRTVLPAFFSASTPPRISAHRTRRPDTYTASGVLYSPRLLRMATPPKTPADLKTTLLQSAPYSFPRDALTAPEFFFQYIPHRKVTYFDNIAQTADQLCPPFKIQCHITFQYDRST